MEAVFSVLVRATSQDPAVFRPASEQLQAWESQRGYHRSLAVGHWYTRARSHSLRKHSHSSRQKQLSDGWPLSASKTASKSTGESLRSSKLSPVDASTHLSSAICEEEKIEIRARLLAAVIEPNFQVLYIPTTISLEQNSPYSVIASWYKHNFFPASVSQHIWHPCTPYLSVPANSNIR